MELELIPKEAFGPERKLQLGGTSTPAYTGKERRRQVRRILVDRRTAVRFEDRTDRRVMQERRSSLRIWDGRRAL